MHTVTATEHFELAGPCMLTQGADRAEHMPVTPVRMLMIEKEIAPLVKILKSRFNSCL